MIDIAYSKPYAYYYLIEIVQDCIEKKTMKASLSFVLIFNS